MKGLLEKGLCWRIGNGEQVQIWEDAWVLGIRNYKVHITNNSQNFVYVSKLMDKQSNLWKEDVIRNTFQPDDAKKILYIPLPIESEADKMVWSGEASGSYSVWSSYKKNL